jgi:uncharacterized protein (DUF2141 family)
MKTLLIAAAATLALAAPALAQDPQTGSVTFEFATGKAEGTVMVALFDRAEAWGGRGAAVANQAVPAGAGVTTVTFTGLAPGDYAMRAMHDVNDDGELNTNPFGMPTEPYAFSNGAIGNMGPASWAQARFSLDGTVVQAIELR